MSAAEKLKALNARNLSDDRRLWASLPQIVAVVEAAERFDDEDESAMAWANIKRDIRAALAALDEALGDVT